MDLERKLAILADAAKYDASCASSGAPKRHSAPGKGLGSTTGMGICHSYTPDGRCVSLLKILLTNFCLYDCQYCVNRRSSDIPRARFAADEVVSLRRGSCTLHGSGTIGLGGTPTDPLAPCVRFEVLSFVDTVPHPSSA